MLKLLVGEPSPNACLFSVLEVSRLPLTRTHWEYDKNIKKYDGFLALGCVIKGETPHFEFISQASTNAIMDLSIIYKKPIGNSIITLFNKNQASKRYNKGKEAANAIIEVLKIK